VALAPRLAAWESARRAGLARIDVELRGAADFPLPDGGQVRLSARADRVEQLRNGGLALIDFKTGSPPSAKQIKAGLAPQLFLEAALASRVAFKAEGADGVERTLGPGPVADAAYVKLRAGDDDELKTVSVAKPEDLAERAERHLEGFIKLVNEFRKGERPFASQFAPEFMRHAGDYDHLARVDEWRIQGGGEDGDG
jgi:ATP-dependent helicase/nuclease subunit B